MQVYPATAIALRSDSYVTITSRGSPASLERWTATTLPVYARCLAMGGIPYKRHCRRRVFFLLSTGQRETVCLSGNRQGARTHTALFNFMYTKIKGRKRYSLKKDFFNTLASERIFNLSLAPTSAQ